MSKRISKYQEQLEILHSELESIKGLSGIPFKIRLVCLCIRVYEVRESLTDLLSKLKQGEPVMDECIDFTKLKFNEWNFDFGDIEKKYCYKPVNTIINHLQDIIEGRKDCENFKDADKRINLNNYLNYILNENNIPAKEFAIICKCGIEEICDLLNDIKSEVDNHKKLKYLDKQYEKLYDVFKKKSNEVFLSEKLSSIDEFNSWCEKADPSIDALNEKRNEHIESLLKGEFCKICDEFSPSLNEVTNSCKELSVNTNRLSNLDEILKRRYGRFRKMFIMEDDCYCLNKEHLLGKYIHSNRENLCDDEICDFIIKIGVIDYIQNKIREEKKKNVEPWVDGLLKYVVPLKACYKGKDFDELWNELICNNENILKGDKKRNLPLKLFGCRTKAEEKDNRKYDKVVVQNIIGYMKESEMISGSTNIAVAQYLESGDKAVEKCEAQISFALKKSTFDEQNLTKLKAIIDKYKQN